MCSGPDTLADFIGDWSSEPGHPFVLSHTTLGDGYVREVNRQRNWTSKNPVFSNTGSLVAYGSLQYLYASTQFNDRKLRSIVRSGSECSGRRCPKRDQ